MLSISARRSLGKPPGSKPEPIILNLPFEIRELIYEYTRDDSFYELYHADFHENQQPMSIFRDLLDDYRIQTIDARRLQAISPHELQDKRSRSRYYVRHNGRVALLRVCKQTYREYRLIFLGRTKFYATCDHSADRIATLLPKTWLPFIKEFVGSFARLDAITPSVFPKLERVEIVDFGSIPKDFDNHYTLDEFLNTSPNDLIDTVLQEPGNQTLQARERRVHDMLPIIQRLSPQVDFIIHANCRLRDRIGPGEAPTGRFDDFWVYYVSLNLPLVLARLMGHAPVTAIQHSRPCTGCSSVAHGCFGRQHGPQR